ncbi:MAG: hypothetical protein AAGC79_06540 [Pseudomonadota bacterium]
MDQPEIWTTDWLLRDSKNIHLEKLAVGSEERRLRRKDFIWPICNYLPVDPAQAPIRAWDRGISRQDRMVSLPDFFTIAGGLPCVTQKARELLERFDIGDSLFFEVLFSVNRDFDVAGGPYFFFNMTCQKSGTVLPDQSPLRKMESGRWQPDSYGAGSHEGYTVNASSQEGCDIWGDPVLIKTVFLSPSLASAIRDARLTGRRLFPCKLNANPV